MHVRGSTQHEIDHTIVREGFRKMLELEGVHRQETNRVDAQVIQLRHSTNFGRFYLWGRGVMFPYATLAHLLQ